VGTDVKSLGAFRRNLSLIDQIPHVGQFANNDFQTMESNSLKPGKINLELILSPFVQFGSF
jgi:hypothetical protein